MTQSRGIANCELTCVHGAAFFVLTVAVCASSWFARPAFAGKPGADTSRNEDSNYARMPETVIPYRNFQKPYVRFFQKAMDLRESGRESPAADLPDSVRIGVMSPGAGAPDAGIGSQMVDGITLAIEQANAAGGYRGIPFQTVLREDAGTWGSSANEMVAFKHVDNVLAVMGSIDGAATHIALRLALKTQVPMVNTATTDPTLTETKIPWLLRCMADDRQQGYALAHYLFIERGIKKVAAFRVNDRFGRMGIAEFRDAARRLKHPLRLELRWNRGDRDFSNQLNRISQTGAEAVVLWGDAADTAAVVREMRRRAMPQIILGCDRLASEPFLREAGDAAEGVVAVATFDPTESNPSYTQFAQAFEERFGKQADTFAAHAYDGANILIETIRKVGLNRIRIRDSLHEYRRYDGVTGAIEFDTTLNDIGSVYIATVTDGRYVYKSAEFRKTAHSTQGVVPYRTIAESPPTVRVGGGPSHDEGRETIRIGCFLPLDQRGQSAVRGLKMALADDADANPDGPAIQLVVRDSRGVWGDNSNSLTQLVVDQNVLAIVGSTERRGTHLIETLAAKLHIPLVTLTDSDSTVHAIPLPWVFSVAPGAETVNETFAHRFARQFGTEGTAEAAMGYDAGLLVAGAIRGAATTRTELREKLSATRWHDGVSGTFRFDALGRRVNRVDLPRDPIVDERDSAVVTTHELLEEESSH